MTTRRTRIVATIGPASESEEMLRTLIRRGIDVVRLNFSHGAHDWHREVFHRVRKIAAAEKRHVAIMQDLQGPRIRTGTLRDGQPVFLKRGARIVITTRRRDEGDAERIGATYERLHRDVKPGQIILLADGTMELVVKEVEGRDIVCKVKKGGWLGEHKGINLPGTKVTAPAITKKDRDDIALGLELGVDMVALSFVRRADDVKKLRRALGDGEEAPLVVSKIEHPEAVENIDAILDVTDAVMVARGDLGLEVSLPRVPVMQKQLIDACNRRAMPVITATQMLESMTHSPRPTRAEATDVANAVFDGTDAVMLSGETASGDYPAQAVAMMDRIVRHAEQEIETYDVEHIERRSMRTTDDVACAVCDSAAWAAEELSASLIVVLTRSGETARRMAWHRERAPILALTPSEVVARRLALTWGVEVEVIEELPTTDELARLAEEYVRKRLPKSAKAPVIMVAGTTVLPGATNTMRVFRP